MARAKASEPQRRAKPSVAEELTNGIAKLRELSTQIDDLSRDGFPYREAVRESGVVLSPHRALDS